MSTNFLTFKRFNDADAADDLVRHLESFDIPCVIEDTDKFFDPTFARDPMQRDIFIKLHPHNFKIAQDRLNEYYRAQIGKVQDDYYLFDFSNQELMEIIARPDEWGDFDNQLAAKILKDRGIEIKPEQVEILKQKRYEELVKPAPAGNNWVNVGVVCLFLGGFAGMFIGWHLYNSKKALPNGNTIYMFEKADRQKGKLIFILGCIMFFITIGILLYKRGFFPFIDRLHYY